MTLTAPDGTKLGIFAINTPQTKTKSKPTNTVGVDIPADDTMFRVAQEQVDALKAEDCDVIICLAHLGISGAVFTSTGTKLENIGIVTKPPTLLCLQATPPEQRSLPSSCSFLLWPPKPRLPHLHKFSINPFVPIKNLEKVV